MKTIAEEFEKLKDNTTALTLLIEQRKRIKRGVNSMVMIEQMYDFALEREIEITEHIQKRLKITVCDLKSHRPKFRKIEGKE